MVTNKNFMFNTINLLILILVIVFIFIFTGHESIGIDDASLLNNEKIELKTYSYVIKIDKNGGISWERTFGVSNNCFVMSIQQTSDVGYIASGEIKSSEEGDPDLYIIKLDSHGCKVWEKILGGIRSGGVNSIQQTSDGGYIASGRTKSSDEDKADVYVMKLDNNGNIVWEKSFSGTRRDLAGSIQQTSDGGYIVDGWTRSFSEGGEDVYVIKLDNDGNRIWEKYFKEFQDYRTSVQQTLDNGYIVVGKAKFTEEGGLDLSIIKLDGNGNKVWIKSFGEYFNSTEWGWPYYPIQQTSDEGYVLAGNSKHPEEPDTEVKVIKLDHDGHKMWEKILAGDQKYHLNSIQQTYDYGYIVAGGTEVSEKGKSDAYIIKLDGNGNKVWEKMLGKNDRCWASYIQKTYDQGYIVGGITLSMKEDEFYRDIYIIKLDCNGTKIWESTLGRNDRIDLFVSIQQTSDSGYIITGFSVPPFPIFDLPPGLHVR